MPSRSGLRRALTVDGSDTGPPRDDGLRGVLPGLYRSQPPLRPSGPAASSRGQEGQGRRRVRGAGGSGAQEERDADAGDRPERAGEGAQDEALGRGRGAQLGEPTEPLDGEDDGQSLRPARQQRAGDRGPFEQADPYAPAQDLGVPRAAHDPGGGRVSGPEDGGRHRSSTGARREDGDQGGALDDRLGSAACGPCQGGGDGEQAGQHHRSPGRAHLLAAPGQQQPARRCEGEQDEGRRAHAASSPWPAARPSSRAAVGRSSRSRSQRAAANRCPTACREMPSSAAASAWVRPSATWAIASHAWSLRRSMMTASAPSTAWASLASVGTTPRTASRTGRCLAAWTARRALRKARPVPARVLAGRGLCTGPAPIPMSQPPRRTSWSPTSTTTSGSASTPWNSSPAVRSKGSTVGTDPLSRRSTSATRSGPRRLARWSTVRTYGTSQV